ncbi:MULTISPECIES: pyruvate synthase subunit PorD [unclassified Methanothermobacter]|uniref:pyruvate synthase subunit PorD n=1 Tax=unclassified Methanothermobacter TaxID=2631116 RepID=UPI0011C7109E|nr:MULTISPECIES: pyruvate synthase subunit PorD [unclassified Methanothermobacter]MBC7110679.1 4Fe-4S binding protein [Methanothermobacter sp.]MCG2829389.1 4Fe-4S binding protein [Methanothermobacter sp. K4]QEF94208.1 pyruvate synthase [Methanothermobacter sp. KEPCO-1]
MESLGATVREPGSTRKNKTGSWRTFKPFLDKDKCIDCDNCILFCPEGCIDKEHEIDYDYCKGCGICAEECPVKAIKMEREK